MTEPTAPGTGAEVRCSFCLRHQDQVWRMVAGPGVYICNDCVAVSVQILSMEANAGGEASPAFRVMLQSADGTGSRVEYGAVPGPMEQRWLRQCKECGTWNAGAELQACLHCASALVHG